MFGGPKSLPVQSSVLAPEPLLRAARSHYSIDRNATCTLLHHGANDTYLVEAPGRRLVLRVYRHGWRTQPEIQWELSLLEHLQASAAPVAALIRTNAANRFAFVLAPEGPRPVALFDWAPGKECPGDAMTPPHARAYGRALASIHMRADTFQPEHARFELDLDYLLYRPIAALAPHMAERLQDLTYLRRLADDTRDAIVEFVERGLGRGICHGGATGGNARLDQRGEFAFFDFDNSGPGWRAYDIATFRWAMLRFCARRARADENFGAFLEGYRELRGLPRVDEDAVPSFVVARQVWLMGLQAAMTPSQGFAKMNDRYFDRSINFLHDWYKEMLEYT